MRFYFIRFYSVSSALRDSQVCLLSSPIYGLHFVVFKDFMLNIFQKFEESCVFILTFIKLLDGTF